MFFFYQNLFFGVGAELLRLEPEPICFTWSWSLKKIWSRSRGKMARLHNTGVGTAALLHTGTSTGTYIINK